MQLPTEGYQPAPGVYGYIKDIQPIFGKDKEAYGFTALYNSSVKGTGKVWRRVVYVWNKIEGRWGLLCEIRKSATWRGSAFKMDYHPYREFAKGKWSENWFSDEAEAEKFMMLTWEFFV
jgi:hypothetical protein